MADHIFVSNLCLHGRHGVLPEESRLGQKFFLDIDCTVDLSAAVRDDDYGKTVCYSRLCDLAIEVSSSTRFKLIETLADRIAEKVLETFPAVSEVAVRVRKPWAPIVAVLDHVGVEIRRPRRIPVGFSLGSNVGDKAANIRQAIARLDSEPGIDIDRVSHLYRTAPWGNSDQDWFINACVLGATSLGPHDLLRRCKAIEMQIGRLPGPRWGPRVIDIDILFFGETVLETADLTLPHKEMFNRSFVLVPLAEIAAGRAVGGRRIGEAAEDLQLAEGEVVRLDQPSP
jgi:dihydroneopterin aldolase/2-amino-4-hydroxy-6-hydroxymethyldihydropteridine diphosphokinase